MIDLTYVKIIALKDLCVRLKLKSYGSKQTIFGRIQKYYLENQLGEFKLGDLSLTQTPFEEQRPIIE